MQGEAKDSHGEKEGEFDSSKITMKKWTEFERDRMIKEARARSEAMIQQDLSKRWLPADLSIEIDRSTLSNLIGSSLSDSSKSFLPSQPIPSSPPPLPKSRWQHDDRSSNLSAKEDFDEDIHHDNNQEDEHLSLDSYSSSCKERFSIECLSTELPEINHQVDLEESWKESVLELTQKTDL